MHPVRPRAGSRREPITDIPLAVVGCIAVLVCIHGARALLSPEADLAVLLRFAFIPARRTVAWDPARLQAVLGEAAQQGFAPEAAGWIARHVLAHPGRNVWSVLTYALLHGSWAHVLFNGVWFAAFGTPVARRCGSLRLVLL